MSGTHKGDGAVSRELSDQEPGARENGSPPETQESDQQESDRPKEATEEHAHPLAWAAWPQRTVWAVFGGLVVAGSIMLDPGTVQEPGPGFWPLAAGALILLAAFAIRSPVRDEPTPEKFSHNPGRLLLALASIAGFIALFAVLGLVLPVLAVLVLWFRLLAGMRWVTTVPTALVVTAALTVGLVYGLDVPLPADPLIALLEGTP
ncbi:tripartite tricarboxylate transporter TctB family protein [Nocardiopsis oceani]